MYIYTYIAFWCVNGASDFKKSPTHHRGRYSAKCPAEEGEYSKASDMFAIGVIACPVFKKKGVFHDILRIKGEDGW